MRFATIPMGSPSPPLAAADDLPFTQPPEILNHDMPPPPPRVLSVATRDPEIRPSSQFYIPARYFVCQGCHCENAPHVWGISQPRSYPIFFLSFVKVRMMYLIRMTGEGKSLVLMGMATILRGVTVCLVPLLGLGISQASNITQSQQHRIEGYHVNEYRDDDF
eukprot:scaffold47026_cov113-Cyclotella_meneghiniana.AAC.5